MRFHAKKIKKLIRKLKNKIAIVVKYKKTRKFFKKNIKKFINYFTYAFAYCFIIPASYLIPKEKNALLITRFGDFEGNLKYFFLYLNNLEEKQGWKFTFLTKKQDVYQMLKEKGFNVWYYPRFTTYFKLLRVRIVIVDGNEWATRLLNFYLFNTKKVQVWHGTGIKTIMLLRPKIQRLSNFRKSLKREYIYYHILNLTSEYQVKTRGSAYRHRKVIINGLPRNDIFYDHKLICESDLGEYEEYNRYKSEGFYIVTYTPTWRKNGKKFRHLDFEELNDFAEKNNILIIIKFHYKQQSGRLNISNYRNIKKYNKYNDVYPLLTITDLLITDYSSIYLDYLLMDKPIVFYPYDEQDYLNERELLLDYKEITPGPKCYNQSELQNEIYSCIVEAKDLFKQQRKLVRDKFFHYQDGLSSERLWDSIKNDLIRSKLKAPSQ